MHRIITHDPISDARAGSYIGMGGSAQTEATMARGFKVFKVEPAFK